MPVKIYSLPIQHNYCAIHATCKFAGLDEEFVPCNIMEGEQMKPEYLAKFPMHCIPALEDTDTGLCVTETNAILRYIARKTSSKLYPDDLKQACIVDMVLDHKLSTFGPAVSKLFIYHAAFGFPAATDEEMKTGVEKLKKDQWPAIQKFITESKGPFVCGGQITIADLSLWGHVKCVALLFGTSDCELFTQCAGLKEWFEAVEGSIGADWFSDELNWGLYKGKAVNK